MKVSYAWLQEFFDEKLPSAEEVGELLTFHAYELEGIEEVEGDKVIDVDVLPNRSSDSLSHRGIAAELSTLLNIPFKDPYKELPLNFTSDFKTADSVTLTIEPDSKCRRAMKRHVKNIEIKESPDWLKEKLAVFGQRSINNMVDITNYITLYLGQPVHAFDYDKLAGEKKDISIRAALEGEELETLDGHKVTLDQSVAVIADAEKALDIAGVKGGANSGIDENTKNVLLSVSNFDPVSVRQASRKLKIITDASARFQNDPSADLNPVAMEHLAFLVSELCGGEVSEDVLDEYPIKRQNSEVSVSTEQINSLLGTKLQIEEVQNILDRLRFEHQCENDAFTVKAPFERTDINIYEDVIEEVGRVHGYEHLEAKQLPDIGMQPDIHKDFYYADKIRNVLNEIGFSEIYGYAFTDSGELEAISALASDKSFLRVNLSDGMKEYVKFNAHNAPLFGLEKIKIFEIGKVYKKEGEHRSLCLGVSGKKAGKELEEAKTVLEDALGVKIDGKEQDGILEIHFSNLMDSLEDPDAYDSFESNFTEYKQFSLYPFVLRDIALWVPNETNENEIVEMIQGKATDLLVRIDQFDSFEKEGKVSYAYHLVFQSMERTLSDEEINKIMEDVTGTLNDQEGFEVR